MKKTAKNYSEMVCINGKYFEYFPNKPVSVNYNRVERPCFNDIYSWYGRPSVYKARIWADWHDWFYSVIYQSKCSNRFDDFSFGICSANCMQFSITGRIINPETGECIAIHITKDHNRAYPISD